MKENEQELLVMKFGGSSVENGAGYHHAANIIRDYSQDYRIVVVVSAMYGVTDQLYNFIDRIQLRNYFYGSKHKWNNSNQEERILALEKRYIEVNDSIIGRPLTRSINYFGEFLRSYLKPRWKSLDPSEEDFIVSYGERLSYPLLSQTLLMHGVNGVGVDPISVIATDNFYGQANVNLGLSEYRAENHLRPLLDRGFTPVIGGFYGLSKEGRVAVLGRDGSDYSAAILANVLNARRLILWKEVDGIYSADPKLDPDAKFYSKRNHEQAKALVLGSGAKIIHPEAIDLLKAKNIPIQIKSFKDPNLPGSLISSEESFEGR